MFVLQKDDGKLLLVPEHQKPGSPAQFLLLLLVEWSHKKSASWQSINSCVTMTQVNAASEWFSILRDRCFHDSPAAQENCSPNLMQYAFLWCHMRMNTHVAKMGVCAHIPTYPHTHISTLHISGGCATTLAEFLAALLQHYCIGVVMRQRCNDITFICVFLLFVSDLQLYYIERSKCWLSLRVGRYETLGLRSGLLDKTQSTQQLWDPSSFPLLHFAYRQVLSLSLRGKHLLTSMLTIFPMPLLLIVFDISALI